MSRDRRAAGERRTAARIIAAVVLAVSLGSTSCASQTPSRDSSLHLIPAKRSPTRALVLVHGFRGDGKATWTSTDDTYWPDLMRTDRRFDDVDIYVYDYPTTYLGSCLAITELANDLIARVKDAGVLKHEQVIFLAHSMGGLIVRHALVRSVDLSNKVPALVFLATPTQGAAVARMASVLPTCIQLDDLRPADINSSLRTLQDIWLGTDLQTRIRSHCAYETESVIVDQSSATALCNTPSSALIGRDHSASAKPDNLTDMPHVVLSNALDEAASRARVQPPPPRVAAAIVIDGITEGGVEYHYRITNLGPGAIDGIGTDVIARKFVSRDDRGAIDRRLLAPGAQMSILGGAGDLDPKSSSQDLRLSVRYRRADPNLPSTLVMSFGFRIRASQLKSGTVIDPISTDDAPPRNIEEQRARLAEPLRRPVGTLAMVVPETNKDGKPNHVTINEPDGQKRFHFDPEKRLVSFTMTTVSGRRVQLQHGIPQTRSGTHVIHVIWDIAKGAAVAIDGRSVDDGLWTPKP